MSSRWVDGAWWLLLAAGSSGWCLAAARDLGPTFDEPFYLRAGLEAWRTGSNDTLMRAGTMPLPVHLQTLPVYLLERRSGEPFEPTRSVAEPLPVARAANLVFWWALLLYGLLWGRALGGPWAGRLACGLLAAEPNLLAHAALATTDTSVTAAVLVAGYHFLAGRDRSWRRRVLLPGLLFGAALACKASALTYVPIVWAVCGLWRLNERSELGGGPVSLWERLKQLKTRTHGLQRDMVQAGAIGAVVLVVYCGSDWRTDPSFIAWADALPDGPVKAVMRPVAAHAAVLPNAVSGVFQQVRHNAQGHHGAYLFGTWHDRSVWYYYPAVLSAKVPDATLVLLAALLVVAPRSLATAAGWVALALLLFSLTTRVQIGVRLVLPLVAFLNIALAVAVVRTTGWRRPVAVGLGVIALVASALATVAEWPDTIQYVNRLHGGSERGHGVFADSNYDWGQGLPELRAWCRAHGDPTVHVWQYGTDPAVDEAPLRRFSVGQIAPPLPAAGIGGGLYAALNPTLEATVANRIGDGCFAVGASILAAYPNRRPDLVAFLERLKTRTPVGRTRTMFIYDASALR